MTNYWKSCRSRRRWAAADVRDLCFYSFIKKKKKRERKHKKKETKQWLCLWVWWHLIFTMINLKKALIHGTKEKICVSVSSLVTPPSFSAPNKVLFFLPLESFLATWINQCQLDPDSFFTFGDPILVRSWFLLHIDDLGFFDLPRKWVLVLLPYGVLNRDVINFFIFCLLFRCAVAAGLSSAGLARYILLS